MKYQNLQAFEKHLREASPAHLSRVYMVISPDEMERRRIAEKIAGLFEQGGGKAVFYCGDKESFYSALELLRTPPLFSKEWVVLLDGIDQLKKEEITSLAAYVASPSSFAYLILSAAEAPASPNFYQEAKKELVLLDMSGEKPWDKKGRMKEWLIAEAAKEKKVLASEAALFLLEHVGIERAGLEQELFKLLTFAGEKKNLGLAEVRAISCGGQQATLWKLSEQLVWGDESLPRQPSQDISELLAFIAMTRTHLETGLRAQNSSSVPPKYAAVVKRRRPDFFSRALTALFEIELKAKSLSLSADFLWDLLVSKVVVLK